MKKFLASMHAELDLQQFAEGGAANGSAAGATAESGLATAQADNGQVAADNGNGADDREARFEELMNGEFKDLYEARLKNHFDKRSKGMRETVDKYNALLPTLEILSNRYKVDTSDIESLNKAIEEDNSFFEDEAMERGISVEELKRVRNIERENSALKKQMQEQQSRERADKLYKSWLEEADKIKQIYPNFDLKAELENPDFVDLLKAGVGIEAANIVVHKDEIIGGAMQFSAQKAEQKVTNRVIANGARPTENGLGSQAAISTSTDVTKMTKAQIDEICARVARGERITL